MKIIVLITIAQALHWFDFDAFKQEAHRVLKPTGVIAAWCYSLMSITPTVDTVVNHYANEALGPYWAQGREYIENNYRDIPFPLASPEHIEIPLHKILSFEQLIGYLESWSPRIKYLEVHGEDIMDQFRPQLAEAWGDTRENKPVV